MHFGKITPKKTNQDTVIYSCMGMFVWIMAEKTGFWISTSNIAEQFVPHNSWHKAGNKKWELLR